MSDRGDHHDQQMPELDTAGEAHDEGRQGDQGGGAEILDDDEQDDDADGKQHGQETAEEFFEIERAAGQAIGEEENDAPFAQLRRLERGKLAASG